MDKVTIVVAMYNASSYISQAIESCLDQTHPNWELIVVDDCSTDDSVQRVEAHTDPRIRLLTTAANSGPASARNIGLDAATGDWLTVLDADDAFHERRLELLLAAAKVEPTQRLLFDSLRVWPSTASVPSSILGGSLSLGRNAVRDITAVEWIRQFFFSKPFLHREMLSEGPRYRTSFKGTEDTIFFLEMVRHAGGLSRFVDTATYVYRVTPGSLMGRGRLQSLDSLAAMDFLLGLFEGDGDICHALSDRVEEFELDLLVADLKTLLANREVAEAARLLVRHPKNTARLPSRLLQSLIFRQQRRRLRKLHQSH